MLRFSSWNVDGLERLLGGRPKGSLASVSLDLATVHRRLGQPDVLCLQEVRMRPTDAPLRAVAERALPGYVSRYALCDDPENGGFRGGRTYGVATYVHEALSPRWLPPPAWDREGRVLACELPELGLAIVNVYAPNGTSKPHFDHALGRVSADRSAFKLHFQQQLLCELQALQRAGLTLALLGDWNVSRTRLDVYPRLRTEHAHVAARAMWNETFIPELDLVDVFRAHHSDRRAYTWFRRSAAKRGKLDAARVDYVLLSRVLAARVRGTDIDQELAFQLGSDHAPLWLELER